VRFQRFSERAANGFVVWVVAAGMAALRWPGAFAWFQPCIPAALGVIMFGMGMTLTAADFRRVAEKPYAVGVGVLAQYLIMPFWGAAVAKLLRLPSPLAAGVILVGACPGGTASNVMTYLAKGDVALSVTMTSVSTLLSVAATPYLTQWLAGAYVPVNATELLVSIAQVILLPVAAGLLVRRCLGKRVDECHAWMPLVSVGFIVMIVGCVVALSKDKLFTSGLPTFGAVALHNVGGLVLGYGLARLAGLDAIRARTISIEVGMQNSGLGVALARRHFTDVLVALPSAIFSVCHNITGPAVATYWSRRPPPRENDSFRHRKETGAAPQIKNSM
jgi:BASS family bile acid:Na+ symporter